MNRPLPHILPVNAFMKQQILLWNYPSIASWISDLNSSINVYISEWPYLQSLTESVFVENCSKEGEICLPG